MSDEFLQEAINDIPGGSAICFIGAGFSWGAKDATGKPVPSVAKLTEEICEFPGLEDEKEAQLTDLAEFCNDDPNLKQQLVTLLINRLTLCTPSSFHRRVMQMPWRAVFTTNFDDVAERSLTSNDTLIITPTFDVRNLRANRKPLYYLHGRALDFLEGTTDPRIVLSETNYLEIKRNNINLYAMLENEIHAASRIFFIGYSIRDAEIATRLFAIEGLREKSVVICSPDEKAVAIHRLKKFGTTYNIGVEAFSSKLMDKEELPEKNSDINLLRFVNHIEPRPAKNEITSSDVDLLLLSGDFDFAAYAVQRRERHGPPEYCVPRSRHLNAVFDSDLNRFVVTSDLGNGKSVFMKQVAFEAQSRGFEVFEIRTQMPEALSELDVLLASPIRRVYIIDGFLRYRKVIKHIGARIPNSSIVICSASGALDESGLGNVIDDMGGVTREIDLNILDSEEVQAWENILERWGIWGDRIEDTASERIEFIRNQCGSENRAIVLSLFEHTRLGKKIDDIVTFFLMKNENCTRGFIAILINSLCYKHVEWGRIVDWIQIDNSAMKSAVFASPVGGLMTGRSRWYEFTSTELASYIFSHYDFEIEQVVDIYTKVVRETAYSANDPRGGFDARENLKELMRFRFLTRLFSNPVSGVSAISAVYQRLSGVPRIRTNDQFWLQYAMARMEEDDLSSAETYLKTAIGLAEKKGQDYSKFQIVDQRARLLFRKNAKAKSAIVVSELRQAAEDIASLLNDRDAVLVHPLRSARHILEFIEAKADKLDRQSITILKETVDLMNDKMPSGRLEKSQRGETESIRKAIRSCRLILDSL